MHYITDHESNLADVDRYVWQYFPSLDFSSDTECSTANASTQPSATNRAALSSSTSNSLVAPPLVTGNMKEGEAGVAVVTFSTDPYNEFKRSMMKMLEAYRAGSSQLSNQEFLVELVLCYLAENENCVHKHIIKASTDILMEIRESSLRFEQKTGVEVEEEEGKIIDS